MMNGKLSLLKVLPLVALTTGLLMPTNIAEAAGSNSKESYTKTEITEKAGQSDAHQKPVKITKILLSKKAQKIEFFGLLGLIGVSLLIPELAAKSSKKVQKNSQSSNSNSQDNLQLTSNNQNKPDISYLEEILKHTKTIDFTSNNLVKLEDHKKNSSKSENNHRKIS